MATTVSFESDIMPIFAQYQANMIWRFDITSYDVVRANAKLIYSYLTDANGPMPPPPYPPLTQAQIQSFQDWMNQGFPP